MARGAVATAKQMLLRLGLRYTHGELYTPTGLMHPSYRLVAPQRRTSLR